MSVDPAIVEWLKTGAYYSAATDAAAAAKWGALANSSSIDSALALKGATDAEAARQLAVLGGPLALDVHVVPGDRSDLRQRCITLVIDRLGYDVGVSAFVVAADATKAGQTTLIVVRRL